MQKSLVKAWLIGLGIGMLILCIAGVASNTGNGWLQWLDLAGAAFSIWLAGSIKPLAPGKTVEGGIIGLSVGVFVLWVIGLVAGATPFLVWWNLAFATAFFFVGLAAISKKEGDTVAHDVPPRKVA